VASALPVPTEIELKLAIDPTAIPRLLRHPALEAVRRGRLRTNRLVAHYYDSPDARLARDDLALRVRREGRRWIQTLKGPAEPTGGAGLQIRGEWAWPVRDAAVEPALVATTPWHKVLAKALRRGGLVRCFTTEFTRRTVPLAFPDGTQAELAIDRGDIRALANRRLHRAPICEIEIELKAGEVVNLYRLALALMADLPLTVLADSKAARGYALRRGAHLVHDEPVHATHIALASDASAVEALAAVARECLHQIAANAAGLLGATDPEWIHQMRVGTRRLRSCLTLVAHAAPAVPLDDVRADVKWLAQILGPARDWDVFATHTLPPFVAAFVRDETLAPGLARVRARVAARRRAARAAARAAVASPRFTACFWSPLAVATPDGDPLRTGLDAASASERSPSDRADAFAAALLARRHRKLLERGAALAQASDQERHAARIAAKRLRYAAEFFAPLFARRRAGAYVEALAELQDVLGRCNDAASASTHSAELAGTADATLAAAIAAGAAQAPRLCRASRGVASLNRPTLLELGRQRSAMLG
jgi:inorganic triphosphatase YgiF